MGYAVEMFFDKKSENAIRGYWENLHNNHLSMSMHESGNRPHISLAVYNNVDAVLLSEKLYKFLIGRKTVKLRFESISVFPTDPAVILLHQV